MSPPRTMAVWCPDWSVTAAAVGAGISGDLGQRPMVVLHEHRVVATNAAGRAAGVRRGQRKREAQYRCPSLLVLTKDPALEARVFEPVVRALESVAAGVEITRPGLVAIGARGPARYYGGEEQALGAVAAAITDVAVLGQGGASFGIADGAFAAALAARTRAVVAPGESPRFLAPLPISTLGSRQDSALVDVLLRLGIRTLGDFAGLPPRDVAARFGPSGAWAHRLAGGGDDRPIAARQPPADCAVRVPFEPALERADSVTFSARVLAEQFVAGLADRGAACVCVEIGVQVEAGPEIVRRWRHTDLLTSVAVLDRLRWQLEGLFSAEHETGGVIAVRLTPIETVPLGTHQLALWGGAGERDERAERGLARVQSQYGQASVTRLVRQGGTGPSIRTGRVAWGEPAEPETPPQQPWPGRLPAPAPTLVLDPPRPVHVLDEHGQPVVVTDRGIVRQRPATLSFDRHQTFAVTTWAGPWPDSDEFWNLTATPDARRVRCQLVDVNGRAYVATCRTGTDPSWLLEGVYD